MIVPEHVSVVVGAVAVAEHSPVTSAKTGFAGFSVSLTFTVDTAEVSSHPVKVFLTFTL